MRKRAQLSGRHAKAEQSAKSDYSIPENRGPGLADRNAIHASATVWLDFRKSLARLRRRVITSRLSNDHSAPRMAPRTGHRRALKRLAHGLVRRHPVEIESRIPPSEKAEAIQEADFSFAQSLDEIHSMVSDPVTDAPFDPLLGAPESDAPVPVADPESPSWHVRTINPPPGPQGESIPPIEVRVLPDDPAEPKPDPDEEILDLSPDLLVPQAGASGDFDDNGNRTLFDPESPIHQIREAIPMQTPVPEPAAIPETPPARFQESNTILSSVEDAFGEPQPPPEVDVDVMDLSLRMMINAGDSPDDEPPLDLNPETIVVPSQDPAYISAGSAPIADASRRKPETGAEETIIDTQTVVMTGDDDLEPIDLKPEDAVYETPDRPAPRPEAAADGDEMEDIIDLSDQDMIVTGSRPAPIETAADPKEQPQPADIPAFMDLDDRTVIAPIEHEPLAGPPEPLDDSLYAGLDALDLLNDLSKSPTETRISQNVIGLIDVLDADTEISILRDSGLAPGLTTPTEPGSYLLDPDPAPAPEPAPAQAEAALPATAPSQPMPMPEPAETEMPDDAGTRYFPVTPEQIEQALERVVRKVFAEQIETIIHRVIDQAVSEEMQRFRSFISGDADPSIFASDLSNGPPSDPKR